MCGITAIYSFRGAIAHEDIERFTDALAHRGPDGRGVFVDANVALGHRRLSILDLSDAGRCPMRYVSPAGRELYITFNGEVFNFIELRRELQAQGHRFTSDTDTEVIVAAYAEWGKECVHRFNGMWAFAIFDVQSRDLFVSRDRFSIKPCYAHISPQRVAVASEIKAFLALHDASLSFNERVIQPLWERSRYDGCSGETAAREVVNIPGGHSLLVRANGDAVLERWWSTKDHCVPVPARYEEQVEIFRELFLDAVRIRMRSDVPVATCLSGGIDSSSVASAMHYLQTKAGECGERIARDWQNTFIATFPGTVLDEKRYADVVAQHIGARPHYVVSRPDESIRLFVENVWCLDEPGGGVAVPAWTIYRALREAGIVVSLDGHGGDELLGGYWWHLQQPLSALNESLYGEFSTTLLPSILKNFDRCSMAHGIEVRMPLLDHRLVSFATSLPPSSKIGGGFSKRIFRDAVRGIAPASILNRQSKIGFNAPLLDWLNGPLVPFMERIFGHEVFLSTPQINAAQIRDEVLAHCRARAWTTNHWDMAYKVTMLVNLTIWRLLFVERKRELVDEMLSSSIAQLGNEAASYPSDCNSAAIPEEPAVVIRYCSPCEQGLPSEHIPYLAALGIQQLRSGLECRVDIECGDMPGNLPMSIAKNIVSRGASVPAAGSCSVSLMLKTPISAVEKLGEATVLLLERGATPPSDTQDVAVETFGTPDELIACVERLLKGIEACDVSADAALPEGHNAGAGLLATTEN